MNTTNTTENPTPNVDCGESTPLSLLPEKLAPTEAPTPGPRRSSVAPSGEIQNHQSSIVNLQSSPSPAQQPQPRPKFIDTLDIPFPKTLDELTALDATREIPYLKALCNRRFIATPGPNPTPDQIIPIIEQFLATHRAKKPKTLSPYADIFVEWKLILEDLEEFLNSLRSLMPLVVGQRCPSAPRADQTPSTTNAGGAYKSFTPKPSPISGHSNNSNSAPPKPPAISTNPNEDPKTVGHFNNSPQKNSPTPSNTSQIENPQSSALDRQSAPKRSRRIHPVLSRLTAEQKLQLVQLYEQHSAEEAARLAAEILNIQISAATLQRLYSTYRIAEDNDTRQDLEAAHETSIEVLTEQQLQLRLLQLASRPNMDHTELRAICHSFARLQSVKLSQRRVQLAEAKEARLAQNAEPARDFSADETVTGIRAMMGKPADDELEYDALTESPNENCSLPHDQSSINSPSDSVLSVSSVSSVLIPNPPSSPSTQITQPPTP